ncbi:acyl-CoA dehydrogenase family protein [Rhodococcus sp. B50]|uniref:acyl-CoA dehydrogenase family protein n=1 Tax=Rhodococcus sp. B50 TaxID=2682847 RepID=UPI001BD67335|nr:acyl-CoA dehydrogenase family protein [Rhodococcus sp. B50]MBS9376531.1 putative acyl-CoA dehydrogenase fadE25 [Rhodococcus sp. B50]
MAFELDSAYRAIRDEALEVAAAAEPFAVEADAMSTVHDGVRKLLADSGLWQLTVPGRWGGRFDAVDPLAVCVVREVLMGTSAHLDSLFALQGIGSFGLARAGNDELRDRWIPKVASGEILAGLGLTEQDTGSDLKNIVTRVERDGNRLVLNGNKSFISNGGAAGFYSILAREDAGLSLFLVPGDAPGLTVTSTPEIIAPHVLAELEFDNVEVSETDRIGDPGTAMDHVLATLAVFRVSVAGASIGLAQAALEEAARHAGTRVQFGRPLAKLGAVADMLGASWAELEAARLLTYKAADSARVDPAASIHLSSMAKLVASEVAGNITDRAVQISGRFGLVRDSKLERLYRQARPMRIYEGSSEVLRLGISKTLVANVLADASGATEGRKR